jgi:hypothetical protein
MLFNSYLAGDMLKDNFWQRFLAWSNISTPFRKKWFFEWDMGGCV